MKTNKISHAVAARIIHSYANSTTALKKLDKEMTQGT